MHEDRLPELYTVQFDEQRESWILAVGPDDRIPLERATLTQLVSLYNDIHRGKPLTLIERDLVHELGRERLDLQETVRSLYDYIDDELPPLLDDAAAHRPTWRTRVRTLIERLRPRRPRSAA